MNYYIDFKLLPDPEFTPAILMNALYARLHKALVQLQATDIGVSFPEVEKKIPSMGSRLRLHGGTESLSALMQSGWLKGMQDQVDVEVPRSVPSATKHCAVRRVQAKSSPERLRRRLARRRGISLEEARQLIPDSSAKTLRLPYLKLHSLSTGQPFRLFVDQSQTFGTAVEGDFNAYGMSKIATVPWF